MANIEANIVAETSTIERKHTITDKDELVAAISKLSDAEKAQFYEDYKNGISVEESRENLLQFVRQLW